MNNGKKQSCLKKGFWTGYIIKIVSISALSLCYAANSDSSKTALLYTPPKPNEVQIAFSGIEVPLGRILFVRKNLNYCSVKFTKYWTEKNDKEKYATYEVHYQKDGTGDFLNKNVIFSEGKASMLPPRGPFYPLKWQPGNPEVKCGSLRLLWAYKGIVCFFERGDSPGEYGIELAPTPWTNIFEVNIFDPRVRWYRYNESRTTENIPIDKLWE